jgi:hypothetical protein
MTQNLNIDIQSEEELDKISKISIKNWHQRVVEYACTAAETISNQDTTGKCQVLIDATRAFIRGEITREALDLHYYAVRNSYIDAYDASNQAYSDATDAGDVAYDSVSAEITTNFSANEALNSAMGVYFSVTSSSDSANISRAAYATDVAYYATYEESMILYKDWLIEELAGT